MKILGSSTMKKKIVGSLLKIKRRFVAILYTESK